MIQETSPRKQFKLKGIFKILKRKKEKNLTESFTGKIYFKISFKNKDFYRHTNLDESQQICSVRSIKTSPSSSRWKPDPHVGTKSTRNSNYVGEYRDLFSY